MRREPILDGVFDEWPAGYVLDDDRISLKLGQFDDQIAFALEVNDSTRFYQEPLLDDLKQLPSTLSVCVYRVDLQAARFY